VFRETPAFAQVLRLATINPLPKLAGDRLASTGRQSDALLDVPFSSGFEATGFVYHSVHERSINWNQPREKTVLKH